jgi:hypothetical protein
LTVARLVPRKGHLAAMQAMRLVRRPLHWFVVGEGHIAGKIERAPVERAAAQSVVARAKS